MINRFIELNKEEMNIVSGGVNATQPVCTCTPYTPSLGKKMLDSLCVGAIGFGTPIIVGFGCVSLGPFSLATCASITAVTGVVSFSLAAVGVSAMSEHMHDLDNKNQTVSAVT